jgi:hypothetical protein
VTASAARLAITWVARARWIDLAHPEWWLVPSVGAAWSALAVLAVARASSAGDGAGRLGALAFVCPIPASSEADGIGVGGALAGLGESAVMVVAMMGLLVLPTLHHVGLTGLRSRRRRGPALTLAGFVAVWLPVVVAIDGAVRVVAGTAGAIVAVGLAVGAALAWQRSAPRWRAVRRCGRVVPIAARGWRADVGCVRQGAIVGGSCIVACAGYMAVAAAAGHGIVAMTGLAATQLWERVGRRRRPLPGALIAVGVALVSFATGTAR